MEEVAKQITDKLIKEERIENDRSHSTSKRSKSKPISGLSRRGSRRSHSSSHRSKSKKYTFYKTAKSIRHAEVINIALREDFDHTKLVDVRDEYTSKDFDKRFLTFFEDRFNELKDKGGVLKIIQEYLQGPLVSKLFVQTLKFILIVINPLLVGIIVEWFEAPKKENYIGFIWALAISVSLVLLASMKTLERRMIDDITAKARTSLRVSGVAPGAKKYVKPSRLKACFFQDVDNTLIYISLRANLFLAPLTTICISVIIYKRIDSIIASISFLVLFLVSVASKVKSTNTASRLRGKRARISSVRITKIREILEGIKTIKLNAWEKWVNTKIQKIRRSEIAIGVKIHLIQNIVAIIPYICSLGLAVSLILVIFYENSKQPILSQIFELGGLCSTIPYLTDQLWASWSSLSDAKISNSRLTSILNFSPQLKPENDPSLPKGSIAIKAGNFNYSDLKYHQIFQNDSEDPSPELSSSYLLKDITLQIRPGEFIGVLGKTNSGKTSLLLALINELVKHTGEYKKNGKLAYIPQEPVILTDTIRNNISFGKCFNHSIFDQVVKLCRLQKDIERLESMDHTVVSESFLEGKEQLKHKISLARAVYSNSDIYVIDDILTCLDEDSAKFVMDAVFAGELSSKTRVMATSFLDLAIQMDRVILMDGGKILAFGSPVEVLNNPQYKLFLEAQKEDQEDSYLSSKELAGGGAGKQLMDTSLQLEGSLLKKNKGDSRNAHHLNQSPTRNNDFMDLAESSHFVPTYTQLDQILPIKEATEEEENRASRPTKEPRSNKKLRKKESKLGLAEGDQSQLDLVDQSQVIRRGRGDTNTKIQSSSEASRNTKGRKIRKNQNKVSIHKDHLQSSSFSKSSMKRSSFVKSSYLNTAGKGSSYRKSSYQVRTTLRTGEKLELVIKPGDIADNILGFDPRLLTPEIEMMKTKYYSNKLKPRSRNVYDFGSDHEVYSLVYLSGYLRGAGMGLTTLAILTHFLSTIALFVAYWWGCGGFASQFDNEMLYIAVLLASFAIWVLFTLLAAIFSSYLSKTGSNELTNGLLWSLLRRPLSFFTENQNLIKKFLLTQALQIPDIHLPFLIQTSLVNLIPLCAVLVLAVVVCPFSLLVLLLAGCILVRDVSHYLTASSRIRSVLTELIPCVECTLYDFISGSAILRVFGRNKFLEKRYQREGDLIHRGIVSLAGIRAWTLSKVEFVLCFSLVVVVFGSVANFELKVMPNPGPIWAGLLLLTASTLLLTLDKGFDSVSSLHQATCYLYRIQNIQKWNFFEKPFFTPEAEVGWPSEGLIQAVNLSIRHKRGLPLAINGLDLEIKPAQKVAILGKRGSGKTTFLNAITRVLEIAKDDNRTPLGYITIDNQRIDQIGLHELRNNLAVISEELFLLETTLRSNLDPFEEHTDKEIVEILDKIGFLETLRSEDLIVQVLSKMTAEEVEIINKLTPTQKETLRAKFGTVENYIKRKVKDCELIEGNVEIARIRQQGVSNEDKLGFWVERGGLNLSSLQKQQICVARALLKRPKILLMDEIEAKISRRLEPLLHNYIKTKLEFSTVIRVCSNPVSVIQFDRVLVLGKGGEKVEDGSPLELISEEGYFCGLVSRDGDEFKKNMIFCAQNPLIDPFTYIF